MKMSAVDNQKQLSIVDIRNYMLQNDGRVTNHALVKHFKKYLTHTQSESTTIHRQHTHTTMNNHINFHAIACNSIIYNLLTPQKSKTNKQVN